MGLSSESRSPTGVSCSLCWVWTTGKHPKGPTKPATRAWIPYLCWALRSVVVGQGAGTLEGRPARGIIPGDGSRRICTHSRQAGPSGSHQMCLSSHRGRGTEGKGRSELLSPCFKRAGVPMYEDGKSSRIRWKWSPNPNPNMESVRNAYFYFLTPPT